MLKVNNDNLLESAYLTLFLDSIEHVK